MDEILDNILLIGLLFFAGSWVLSAFEPKCDETCQRMERIREHQLHMYECKTWGECKF